MRRLPREGKLVQVKDGGAMIFMGRNYELMSVGYYSFSDRAGCQEYRWYEPVG